MARTIGSYGPKTMEAIRKAGLRLIFEHGYAAMSLALDAIKRAGAQGSNRQDVINALFAIKNLPSVLGTYSINKDGDTSVTDYGLYSVKNGEIVFNKVVKPQGA